MNLSALGFGCASIMGKMSEKSSTYALSYAFDVGITHFDIARSYGFGMAERALGEFIKNKRDKLTVTSKFGVVPPNISTFKKYLIPIIRSAYLKSDYFKAVVSNRSSTKVIR